jgi:hypothetical protein
MGFVITSEVRWSCLLFLPLEVATADTFARHWICWTLILDCPIARIVRNKLCSFTNYSVQGILLWQPQWGEGGMNKKSIGSGLGRPIHLSGHQVNIQEGLKVNKIHILFLYQK